jgi:hypothetical protein
MYKFGSNFNRQVVCAVGIAIFLFTISISGFAQQQPNETTARWKDVNSLSGGAFSLDNSAPILRMMSTEEQFNRIFTFTNQSTSSITITDFSLATEDVGIKIMSPDVEKLPMTIEPGKSLAVRLGYFKIIDHAGIDTLQITTSTGSVLQYPIVVTHITLTPDQNGLTRRQIALSVQPDDKRRSIRVVLYSGYQGDIAIYTKDGLLVDEAKNVKSYLWRTTPGKKSYDENEYVVRVTCVDGGQTLTRSEKVTFASK